MAPSVEIKYTSSDASLDIQSKENLIFPPSELNVTSNHASEECEEKDDSEKMSNDEKKVKTYRVSKKEDAAAIRNKFPTKIPIIVDRFHKESSLPRLERSKFLVPQEITMSQFVTIIRNRMKLGSNQAFYLLVNNRSMLSLSKTLAEVYKDHKEKDGFLYMTYASQEVFGY